MEQDITQFVTNSDFWISEIRGNIARLNDATAVVETDIVLPTAVDNRISKSDKITKIRNFHFELRRLYLNAAQIMSPALTSKLNTWMQASQEDITNIQMLKEGVKLSKAIQDDFHLKRIKDIEIPKPVFFPFEYYYENLIKKDEKNDNYAL